MTADSVKRLLQRETRSQLQSQLFEAARKVRGQTIFFRGVIEFSNQCRSNCKYCGMRRDNERPNRSGKPQKHLFCLEEGEILRAAEQAYDSGLRSIVLQSGEVPDYASVTLPGLISKLRRTFGDMKLISAVGWQTERTYQELQCAGLDMVILKYETLNNELYWRLKDEPSGEGKRSRHALLRWLKQDLKIKVSSGCIAGLPGMGIDYDPYDDIAKGLVWLKELEIDAASVSPFIPHDQSPLASEAPCPMELALNTVAAMRLVLGNIPIPAVSAFGLLDSRDRLGAQFLAIDAGANVVTVNCTPELHRKDYCIYTTDRNVVDREMMKRIRTACENRRLRFEPEMRGHNCCQSQSRQK